MVLTSLLRAYRRHGFLVRTGLNPLYFNDPDAAFTRLLREDRTQVSVGAGLAPQELHFLECLFGGGAYRPGNVLVVGNAFGWSALALGLLLPDARVVAMEAGLEGNATSEGTTLTRTIAAEEGLDVRVVAALSPRDVPAVVDVEFDGASLDFVLLDGLHTNEQLERDFAAAAALASNRCVFVLHDVLSWHMLEAFGNLPIGLSRERRVLTRCPSGMGVVFPTEIDRMARDAIEDFCDETIDLAEFLASVGACEPDPGRTLSRRLSPGWKLRHVSMADCYRLEGEEALAERQLELATAEARAGGSDDVDLQFRLATYNIDHGRWQDAEEFLNNARRLAPSWEEPAHELGRVMRVLGRHDEARRFFEEALRLKEDWAAPVFELGLVTCALDGEAAAIPWFERVLALEPRSAPAHFEVGMCRKSTGDWPGALEAFERARHVAPDWSAPLKEIGICLRTLGRLTDSAEVLSDAVCADPDWAGAHFELGLTCEALKDLSEAERKFLRAAELRPGWQAPRDALTELAHTGAG